MHTQFSAKWILAILLGVVFLLVTSCIDPCAINDVACIPATGAQGSIHRLAAPTAVPAPTTLPDTQTNAAQVNAELTEASPWIAPSPLHPTIAEEILTVAAGEQRNITVTVAGSVVLFYLFSDTPIIVTLVDPEGWVIDPAIADAEPAVIYGMSEGNPLTKHGWSTLYQVLNPVAGDWQVRIAADAPNSVLLYGAVKSSRQLQIRPDKVAYGYDERVTVRASLEENEQPLVGATISGTVVWNDGTILPLSFRDDGQQGDTAVHDGIYTAHFQTPTTNSRPALHVHASYEQSVQLDQTTIEVIGPTATLLRVSEERAIDANNNGLFDRLELDLLVDVQTAGSYGMQGVLYDSSGQDLDWGVMTRHRAACCPPASRPSR
ncbi:MAG: hypothetical protein DYG89_00020 [Caldilinea sp. CFX5]|nr:hypothetical protein [Caldilinea sp. CFX5]